jgi:transcriptional regulator with XRE-family HTH domain
LAVTDDAAAERLDSTDRWFAANLKAARERAGLSQRALADRMAGYGHRWYPQTVSRVEAAERTVSVGEAILLARFTQASVDDLARAPKLSQEGMALRGAIGVLHTAWIDAAKAAVHLVEARAQLERALAYIREQGKAEELAAEIDLAERVLRDSKDSPRNALREDALQRWATERARGALVVSRAELAALEATQDALTLSEDEASLAKLAAEAKTRHDAGDSPETIGRWLAESFAPGILSQMTLAPEMLKQMASMTQLAAESMLAAGLLPVPRPAQEHQEPAGQGQEVT